MLRSESRSLEVSLMSTLEDLQTRLEKRRDPDLHGGPGNLFEAMTKDDLWEPMVALRASPSVTVDGIMEDAAGRQMFRAQYTRANTDRLLEIVAGILDRLADKLRCDAETVPLRNHSESR